MSVPPFALKHLLGRLRRSETRCQVVEGEAREGLDIGVQTRQGEFGSLVRKPLAVERRGATHLTANDNCRKRRPPDLTFG